MCAKKQELQMPSRVTINCQVAKIGMNLGSQLSFVTIVISVSNVTSPYDRFFRVFSNGGT